MFKAFIGFKRSLFLADSLIKSETSFFFSFEVDTGWTCKMCELFAFLKASAKDTDLMQT